jgi:predicted small secreted protein
MKKLLLSTVLVVALGLTFTSCRDTEKKADDMGDAIETAADDVADKTEGALEKAGKAIDNAANEVKEAGKAIDSAATEVVGDDN